MSIRKTFILCLVLACAGCASGTPEPVPTPAAAAKAGRVVRLALQDGRHLAISVPDGWTATRIINGSPEFDGKIKDGVLLRNEAEDSFVAASPLLTPGRTAMEGLREFHAALVSTNPDMNTSRLMQLDGNPQATFHIKVGAIAGVLTVRHVGEKEDVPVMFLGRWPKDKAEEGRAAYWPTVFKTTVVP